MTLNLSHRKQAILEEMGIALFLKKTTTPAHKVKPLLSSGAPIATNAPTIASHSTSSHIEVKQEANTLESRPSPQLTARPKSAERISPKIATPALSKDSLKSPVNPQSLEALTRVPQMTWPMLTAHLSSCQACEHGHEASQRYFSSPPEQLTFEPSNPSSQVDWLIVADAPKRSMEGSGIAFSQEGLDFLQSVLNLLGFTPQAASSQKRRFVHHITHTLKCLSPNSEVPSALSTQTCLVHLRQEIKLLRPKVLLVMGHSAAQALLYDTSLMSEPLGRLRSKIHQFENTPMLITYTPEQMMRSGENKAKAWQDLCLAQSLCE